MMRTFLKLTVACMAAMMFMPLEAWAQKIDPMLTRMLRDNQETVARTKVRKARGLGEESRLQSYYDTNTRETVIIDRTHEVNGIDTLAEHQRLHVRFNADGSVRHFVVFAEVAEGSSIQLPEGATETNRIGNTLILRVTPEALQALDQMDEVKSIRASRMQKLHNDKARRATSASCVTNETESEWVDHKYDGEGVVVGVVDLGIDFNHPAFRDNEGNTRIKKAVYYEDGIMQVVTEADEIAALTTRNTKQSHGTHTSATAAGSAVNIGEEHDLRGMAPKAELVLCDLGNSLPDDRILASVQQVFDYAEDKPAVVNLSIGSNVGFHDGSDNLTAGLARLTGEGRIICVSAGNEGGLDFSIVKKGTIKTALKSTNTVSDGDLRLVYPKGISIWVNATDQQDFTFKLIVLNTKDGTCHDLQQSDVEEANADLLATSTSTATSGNGKHYIDFSYSKPLTMACEYTALGVEVTGADGNQQLVLMDEYDNKYYTLYGGFTGYDAGTDEMSINILACTDRVLSVGSYIHRNRFTGFDGNSHGNTALRTLDQVAYYSSYGVDDNGKSRPDLVAPGCWTVSAYNIYDQTYFDVSKQVTDQVQVTNYFENGDGRLGYNIDRPYAYGIMTGTSMACPVATGIVALWLQQKRDLTAEQIRSWLGDICVKDKWVTDASNIPSGSLVQTGQGKIDAVRGNWMIQNGGNVEGERPLYTSVTIGSTGLATYSLDQPIDFRDTFAPKAYVATDYAAGNLTLTRAGRVSNNTGILLADDPSTYRVALAAGGDYLPLDYLVGTAEGNVTLDGTSGFYVLAKKDGVVGFYRATEGTQVAQGKAYLDLSAVEGVSEVRGFVFNDFVQTETSEGEEIDIEDALHLSTLHVGEETGIDALTPDSSDAPAYNLAGQRITGSYRGIIITNGKKHIRQ